MTTTGTIQARKGFFIRAAALLIDVVCLMFLLVCGALVLEMFAPRRVNDELSYAILASSWLLISSFEIWTAATPGKMILQLQIGNADATPATMATLVSRWLTKNGWALLLLANVFLRNPAILWVQGVAQFLVMCGCLPALNEARQAWHDQIACTAVFSRLTLIGPDPTPGRGFDISGPA